MSDKQTLSKDQDMMDFQDLYASPAKSEGSSVDIYDGLDMSMTVPEQTTKQSSPSRNCLDLYEEIITEEGTAKEASFNNLNAEYDKCQKQIKQLITKLKEMQCLNTNLQNENQCLKKNISALIKTARVEITRKEEEINQLNQRLFVPGNTRNFKSDPVPLLSCNTKLKEKELPKDPINKPSSIMKNVKPQEPSHKDLMTNYSSTKSYSEQSKPCTENNSESNSKTEQGRCQESEATEKQTSRNKAVVDKKTKKQIDSDSQDRDVDRWRRSEGHRSTLSTVTDDSICEVKEKSKGQPTKTGKSERSQESRNCKMSDVDYKMDSRKYCSSSHNKSSFSKETTHGQELHHSKEKHLKTHEKYEHRKESKAPERDGHKISEKDDGSQRLKRTHSSNLKNEYCQKSSPSEQNAVKKSIDPDRREKRCSEYSDSKNVSKDSKSSNKTDVRPSATKNKYNSDGKSSSERDCKSEKKRSKDEGFGSRTAQNHRDQRKEEKVSHQSSNRVKTQDCPNRTAAKSQNVTKVLTSQREDNSVKDLKLSFMETLNLTLSPAKKKSPNLDPANSRLSARKSDINSVNTEASSKVCINTKDGADSQEHLSKLNPTFLKHSIKMFVEDKPSEDLKLVPKSEFVEHTVALQKEQSIVTGKEDKELAEPSLSNADCPQDVHIESEASNSDMDTQSILNESDLIVLDSYIEIDKSSDNEIASKNLILSEPAENGHDGVTLARISEDVDQTSILKANITVSTTGICESSNTDQYLHDESSVMSLDLNFLRRIPKIVSPLKSPARPLAHLPTTERTAKASVVSISYQDLPSDVIMRTPSELNKENCEPVSKTDLVSETFPIEISSDEVEEGEIISDEEPDNEQFSQSKSSPSQTEPIKDTNMSKCPVSHESKITSLSKPNGVISPLRKSAPKSKTKHSTPKDNTKTKLRALPVENRQKVSADSCLEGVVNIVPPSNIQDVLQMLRIIRKHIRKKYMKFKIQFPLTQFHRFVEAASLYFTTLANRLDWSRLCSLPDRLQSKLCNLIESRLKQLKKNGIVDRIFEQQFIDMKKRLWKFVEEQLDSLFDTFKGMIVKLCDKAKSENGQDEKKISMLSTKVQKSDRIKNSENVCKTSKNKASLAKSENELCLRRLDVRYKKDAANTKPQSAEHPSVEKKLLKDLSTTYDKNGILPCHNMSPKSKIASSSTCKPGPYNECQKDQHSSAGLSFNLVSDDHMGDIFKSLLNDSDNLELNTLHEDLWILDTPEKKSQKYDNASSLTEIKTPVKAAFPWPSTSPPHSLPRLETVINPDVLDESCLLEVPTSTSFNKSIVVSEDRLKSYSVLMEDLAVSLTVPSPLKSDSHLSFLRPDCDPESISQVNAPYSEDAVLDEEDATEQDIHLTLDSDNSSTGSLENSTEPDGFQCHPSEPMQAVIMEKSNDHFIVKIRRAVSSNSPVSDSSSVGESDSAATGKLESTHCNILDESLQQGICIETKLKADANNSLLTESTVPYTYELNSSKIDEKSENATNISPYTRSSPKTVHAKISILPDALNKSLADSSEVQITNVINTEKVQLDCEKFMNVCPEKNPNDGDKKTTIAEKQLMDCDKLETTFTEEILKSQTPCADMFVGIFPETESMDLHLKKRKWSKQEPSSKRQNFSCPPDKEKKEGSSCRKSEGEDKPVCFEKNCDKIKTAIAEKQLMDCDKMESTFTEERQNSQTPCADTFTGIIPETEPMDLNPKKKKRKSSQQEPPSKRQNISFPRDIKDKKEDSRCSKIDAEDKPQRKHRRAVSEGNVNSTSFRHSPNSGISAKNVIKRKGEVVVSWTRNEDREILLECQQHGPNKKTFLCLASKMNKYPHQVEERFRQLMKLFKKSSNSIS